MLWFLLAASMPGAASADVLDVGSNGILAVYRAPGIYRGGSFEPIAPVSAAATRQDQPGESIAALLSLAARRYGLDPALLRRVAWNESRFRADAVSAKGAVGVMQLMDGTARDLGVDRHDVTQNILGGAAYLRQLLSRYGGDTALALAAYNAGPQAVDRFGGLPPFPETAGYVHAILGDGASARKTGNSPVLFDR